MPEEQAINRKTLKSTTLTKHGAFNLVANKLVLDVGSGHKPHPDATHLCDLYLTNQERGANLIINRPFVNASIEQLPFKTGAFNFVYACHVLEHTTNPSLALTELSRVSKKGYIESPSYLSERIYGWRFHKCVILFKNKKLCYTKKPDRIKKVNVHELYRKVLLVRVLHYLCDLLFDCVYTRTNWSKHTQIVFKPLSMKQRLILLFDRRRINSEKI